MSDEMALDAMTDETTVGYLFCHYLHQHMGFTPDFDRLKDALKQIVNNDLTLVPTPAENVADWERAANRAGKFVSDSDREDLLRLFSNPAAIRAAHAQYQAIARSILRVYGWADSMADGLPE